MSSVFSVKLFGQQLILKRLKHNSIWHVHMVLYRCILFRVSMTQEEKKTIKNNKLDEFSSQNITLNFVTTWRKRTGSASTRKSSTFISFHFVIDSCENHIWNNSNSILLPICTHCIPLQCTRGMLYLIHLWDELYYITKYCYSLFCGTYFSSFFSRFARVRLCCSFSLLRQNVSFFVCKRKTIKWD